MGLFDIFKKQKQKNINLIGKEDADGGFSKKDYIIPALIPIISLGLLVFVFAAIFTLEQTEAIKSKNLEEKIIDKTSQWQKFADKAETLKKISNALGVYQEGSDQNKYFEDSTKKIRSVIPNGVKLTDLSVEEEGSVSISGISQNPKIIFQLFNELKKRQQDFSKIELLSIGYQLGDEKGGKQSQEVGFIFTIDFEMSDDKENN